MPGGGQGKWLMIGILGEGQFVAEIVGDCDLATCISKLMRRAMGIGPLDELTGGVEGEALVVSRNVLPTCRASFSQNAEVRGSRRDRIAADDEEGLTAMMHNHRCILSAGKT